MLPMCITRAEVDSGRLCGPWGKRTYDPRARLVSRALERIDATNAAANSSARGRAIASVSSSGASTRSTAPVRPQPAQLVDYPAAASFEVAPMRC